MPVLWHTIPPVLPFTDAPIELQASCRCRKTWLGAAAAASPARDCSKALLQILR